MVENHQDAKNFTEMVAELQKVCSEIQNHSSYRLTPTVVLDATDLSGVRQTVMKREELGRQVRSLAESIAARFEGEEYRLQAERDLPRLWDSYKDCLGEQPVIGILILANHFKVPLNLSPWRV